MTEYDYSPEAYERFIQTQNRVTNWVHHTERHRQGFESAAPGAPGIPPVPRQLSPSIEEPLTHKASPSYPTAPIYHRVPPLLSENPCVQIPPLPPQTRRLRPLPPSKYVPAVPLHMAVHIPPPVGRVKDNRFFYSSSSRHHHARVVSHSHPYHPPPLMTAIYTSPAASPFIPPPPIIHMYSQGHPSSVGTRPVNSLREIYRKSSSLRKARPQTPPATLLSNSSSTPTSTCQTSSPNSPSSAPFPPSPAPALGLLNSGHGGSYFHAFSIPWTENQKHGNISSSTLPRLDSTFVNHNLQEQSFHSCQRLDYQSQSHNFCHSQDRRSVFPSRSHSHFQTRPSLRTQPYAGHSDLLCDNYESKPSPVAITTPHNNTISISVPPRFPPDDRESSINAISSHSHPYMKQITPYVLHHPQPMQHPDMLNPQLWT